MEDKTTKKPKWLYKLEQESWQAELLISGLLIVGTFQLPLYIDYLVDWSITFFSPESYFILEFFFLYLNGVVIFLNCFFVIHFILRTIWVGLLGLNSVFPNGINYETEQYSAIFMENLKKKFPNNHEDILNLERACSMIFATATMFSIIMLIVNINIIILAVLKLVLDLFLPSSIVSILGYLWLFFVVIVPSLLSILNAKRFHKNKKLQTFYFHFSDYYSRIIGTFLNYPMTRISYTFATNNNSKKYGFGFFLIFIFVGFVATEKAYRSHTVFLQAPDYLFEYYSDTTQVIEEHYEHNLNGETKILSAVIPAKEIYGSVLTVFTPVFENESEIMDDLCGEREKKDGENNQTRRRANRAFWLDCAQQYHRFYINDVPYTTQLSRYKHPNQQEKGVFAHFPTNNFRIGKNMLRIEKIKVDGSIYRTINIPFWFSAH